MQGLKSVPADTATDLIEGLLFENQDAQSLAIESVIGLKLADGERCREGCRAHGSRFLVAEDHPSSRD